MCSTGLKLVLSSLLLLGVSSTSADAKDSSPTSTGPAPKLERPVTGYTWYPPEPGEIIEYGERDAQNHTNNIIFLNRCVGDCVINPSRTNDSRTNSSYLVDRPRTITEFNRSDEEWNKLVSCVTALYDPYDVVITDVDPGANVEHFEAIVAGTPSEMGFARNVGGMAPFSCGIINNAITFNFANASFYADDIDEICITVGQETAHAFGLEHEYLCTDPMTYLTNCPGYKWFQDENAACGEYQPKGCDCGTNQNSHRVLSDHFGVGASPGPKMKFVRPAPNSNVEPDFIIEVSADKYYFGAKSVEILINGISLITATSAPFIFNAPEGLDGYTTLEVRATDARGYQSSTITEINVGEACSANSCAEGRVCYKGFCIADATTEGGFGFSCNDDSTCTSKLCATGSDGAGVCTEQCDLKNGDCPSGFGCLKAGGANVCWAGVSEDSGGCGCNASTPGAGLAGMILVFFGLLATRRRRRY